MGSEDHLVNKPQRISEPEQNILRVVNAQHFDNGLVTPEAFVLASNDGNKLSVNQERKITPAHALEQKTEIIRARKEREGKTFTPPSVIARMSVAEIEKVPLPTEDGELYDADESALSVWDDSMLEGTPDSHAYIDFVLVAQSKKRRKAVYNRLAAISNQNGKLFHQ